MSEFLNARVLRELKAGPMTSTELADALIVQRQSVSGALDDLADQGKVCRSLYGERWETTSGGYLPDPGPGSAA